MIETILFLLFLALIIFLLVIAPIGLYMEDRKKTYTKKCNLGHKHTYRGFI